MEKAILIKPGFATADAEYPNVEMYEGDLIVDFQDAEQRRIEIFFPDIVAFQWQMIAIYVKGEKPDQCYEIEGSAWLQAHITQGQISKTEQFKHYKFNFPDLGQLEVLSSRFTVRIQ